MHRSTHRRRGHAGLVGLMLLMIATPAAGFRIGWSTPTESFVNAWAVDPDHAEQRFQSDGRLRVQLIDTNIPANLLRPGEQAELTFQFQNLTAEPMPVRGAFDVFEQQAYNEDPGSLGVTGLRRTRDVARIPFELEIPAEGFKNLTIDPELPERFGGYVVIADVDGHGRFFGGALARIHEVHLPEGAQFRRYTMDSDDIDQLKRLAAYPNRIGMTYKPTTDEDFDQWWDTYHNMRLLRRIGEAGMTTTVEFGHGVPWHAPYQPLGRPRPLLQYVDDKPIITTYYPADMAWKPAYDEDWQEFVYRLCVEYGYPRGPINGVMLWNEPWEGSSIAGWGADMLRYRDMYRHMAKGVQRAREDAGVDVRIGGNDSMSNTFDKFFSDGSTEYLQWLDFMSVHYQGNTSGSTIRLFRQREHENGPTEIWDTESWAANTEEGVAALIAAKASFGYDRIVGIFGGGTMDRLDVDVQQADDEPERRTLPAAWPINAAIAASQKFVGERAFRKLLFDNGLPWVIVFEGEGGERDDGTAIVVGDLGPAFQDEVPAFPFWMVRGLAEAEDKRRAREQLAALPENAASEEREALKQVLAGFQHLRDARMIINDADRRFAAYGTYGNELEHDGERLIVPLSGEGIYVRVRPGEATFDELLEALAASPGRGDLR